MDTCCLSHPQYALRMIVFRPAAPLVRIPFRAMALAALATAGFAAPAQASDETSTRLVRCGGDSCLQVSGYRADPSAQVRINGRLVPVQGDKGWKARLPLETLREWTAPSARSIEVSLHETQEQAESVERVALPIGVLGDSSNLGSLEVRAQW